MPLNPTHVIHIRIRSSCTLEFLNLQIGIPVLKDANEYVLDTTAHEPVSMGQRISLQGQRDITAGGELAVHM